MFLLILTDSLTHQVAHTGRRAGGAHCIAVFTLSIVFKLRALPGMAWVWLAGLEKTMGWVTLGKAYSSLILVAFYQRSLWIHRKSDKCNFWKLILPQFLILQKKSVCVRVFWNSNKLFCQSQDDKPLVLRLCSTRLETVIKKLACLKWNFSMTCNHSLFLYWFSLLCWRQRYLIKIVFANNFFIVIHPCKNYFWKRKDYGNSLQTAFKNDVKFTVLF